MIPQATIDRILSAANIVDVVSGYVSLRRSGASYKGLCPFHDDTTPSFYVSPARGVCKCFSCGEGGNVVHFIMKIEQLSYYEALKFLAKKYGIEVEERELTDEERVAQSERESMFALNEWASNYFHDTLLNTNDGQAIGLTYFRERGFRDDIIEKFRLGFCLQKYDDLAKKALQTGYKEEYLIKTGLCFKRDDGSLRDKYWGRVIFPWFGINGKVTGFGGRVLDARTKGVNQKYINSPESDIYHKANELYGLYQAKQSAARLDNIIMVEGYTDVLSMHQAGIENVVANSGTALSEQQVKLLRRYTRNITLIYDGDEAGIHAALRGTDMLLRGGMRIKILLLPDGDDPDSFARKHNATELQQYIEQKQVDFITFKTNLYREQAAKDPIKKADLIKDIVESISVIPEEIERSIYIHQCSEMMGTNEMVIQREVNRRRQKLREEREKEKSNQQAVQEASTPQAPTENADSQPTNQQIAPQSLPQDALQGTPQQQRKNKNASKFEGLERLIMMLIVKFGNKPFKQSNDNEDSDKITIRQFIVNQLYEDGFKFHSQLYQTMLEQSEGATDIAKTLLNSPDSIISQETASLLTDRYELAQNGNMPNEEDSCCEYASHLMLDYKYAIVDAKLTELMKQFTNPAITSDPIVAAKLLQKQIELSNIKRQLAKMLGERIEVTISH